MSEVESSSSEPARVETEVAGAIDRATRRRERGVLIVLGTVQFISIVDFMLIMPLGPQLMRSLHIETAQLGLVVSAYTLAAGLAGLVAAPYVDRLGRRSAFLGCFLGFILGTLACGLASTYPTLLLARVLAGAFGGILGGMAQSIIGDVFPPRRHGEATGVLMSAFSLASVLGVPFGLILGDWYGWQFPFLLLAGLATAVFIPAFRELPPLRDHLVQGRAPVNPFRDVWTTISEPNHARAYLLVASLMLGSFTVFPFIATYYVLNAGLAENRLFWIYVAGGLCSLASSPIIGRLADRFGRYRVYTFIAPLSATMMFLVTVVPRIATPWLGVVLASLATAVLMVANSGRMVAAMALILSSVEPRRRGGFMSVFSAVQHITGGLGSWVGGLLITVGAGGELVHFSRNGAVAVVSTLASIYLASRIRPNLLKPITKGFALGAADASLGDPIDPLPLLEAGH